MENWFPDGPRLPLEFTRFSKRGRVTLIVDRAAQPVEVLWATMEVERLEDAIRLLADREETSYQNIQSVRIDDVTEDAIKLEILWWLRSKQLPAAIWTGLSYRGESRPSITDVLGHLKSLEGSERKLAEEYVRKAPKQIRTEYRARIEAELGWAHLG